MAHDVIMPQMGESLAEGTITKWLKQVGDAVERDEPLFEISTDKVDAEIPSPASGTLLEITVGEGSTVEVNAVVGRIGTVGEAGAGAPPAAKTPQGDAKPAAAAAPTAKPAAAAKTPEAEAPAAKEAPGAGASAPPPPPPRPRRNTPHAA